MRDQTDNELAVAKLIIDTLNLGPMQPADIDPEDFLFGEGLELDSIDILELILTIKQVYDISIQSGDKDNVKIFSSLASLSKFIIDNQSNGPISA